MKCSPLILSCLLATSRLTAQTVVGGTLTGNTSWSNDIVVISTVTVPAGLTLTILPGTTVRLTNNVGITATGGGIIDVQGNAAQSITFDRAATTFTRWGDLAATGAGSTVTVRHARITRGRVRASSGGTALVEDSELSEMTSTGIIGGNGGAQFTVRRCYVHDYEDIDLINTRTLAEDSLFERANSDIFELQNSPTGSILRRCTFRTCLNPNSDGVDMNGCVNVTIDSCRIYDVTDKGISSGSALSASDPTSVGLVVTNTLIYNAEIGIGIKDQGTASLYNNTITRATDAVAVYTKFLTVGGHVTNGFNNLFWGVTTALRSDRGTAVMDFSDLQGTNFPGTGNISADPLWLDSAGLDFRLGTNSPCRSTGSNGLDRGVIFPVGGLPAEPHNLTIVSNAGPQQLMSWTDVSINEAGFRIEGSADGLAWSTITNVDANVVAATVTKTHYVRVIATNFIGDSFASNVAESAVTPGDGDDDGMPDAWETANGFDPSNSADALLDADSDGASNLIEYRSGTDPRNGLSRFAFERVLHTGPGQVELTFTAVSNKTYFIQFRDSLAAGTWQTLIDVPSDSFTREFTLTDSLAPNHRTRFYRVFISQ
jgi:hypothetical protein